MANPSKVPAPLLPTPAERREARDPVPVLGPYILQKLYDGIEVKDRNGKKRLVDKEAIARVFARQLANGHLGFFKLMHAMEAPARGAVADAPQTVQINYVNNWRANVSAADDSPGNDEGQSPGPPQGPEVVLLPDEAFQLVDRGPEMAQDDGDAERRD